MRASRGMGAINPSKMPGAKRMARRDDADFTQYKKGGKVKKYAEGKEVENPDMGEPQKRKLNLNPQITGASFSKPYSNVSGRLGATYDVDDDTSLGLDADVSMGKEKGKNLKTNVSGMSAKLNKRIGKNADLSAFANLTPGRGVTEGGVNYNYRFEDGGNVNAAGNYTKPEMRKRIVAQVMAAATQGTGAGKWSARKAQLVAKKYKAAGGGYRD